jgi:hypothetical protein
MIGDSFSSIEEANLARLPHSPRFSASGHHGPIQLGASHLTLCNSAHPHLRLLRFVDQHWSPLFQGVMTVTAPVPLFRRQHQTADNRIAMHVTQLLHPLLLREHHEIVETMLSEVEGPRRGCGTWDSNPFQNSGGPGLAGVARPGIPRSSRRGILIPSIRSQRSERARAKKGKSRSHPPKLAKDRHPKTERERSFSELSLRSER